MREISASEINRYNRADGTYSEMLFIPYHKNYNMLNRGIQEMAFIDDNDMLYLCLEDTLYRFDIVMKTSEIVMEQIGSESCSISEDGQSMATVQADESGRTHEILWTNLATGESPDPLTAERNVSKWSVCWVKIWFTVSADQPIKTDAWKHFISRISSVRC